MEHEEIRQKLSDLYPNYGQWTDEDKKELRSIIRALGIKHSFKSGCMSCFDDAFILAKNALDLSTADLVGVDYIGGEVAVGEYTFTAQQPVEWHGRMGTVILDWNTPVPTIEKFIEQFPNQTYFIKEQ